MTTLTRVPENPILSPNDDNAWEKDGAFNGCVAYANGMYHMVYRALSTPRPQSGVMMQVSTVGYATSTDGIHFGEHRMLIEPSEDWEKFGCEDPRITYIDGVFYIFYTALSVFPFAAHGIKLAVAKTKDFKTFEKHRVTPFNSKAMGMFQDKVNGKLAALVTMHTDLPPAKIALAVFDKEEDIWSQSYWNEWYENANDHSIHLLRDMRDQVELGAPPVKTKDGWLVIYSYIKNYLSDDKKFGIEAVLLDLLDPRKIIGRTKKSLLNPEEKYELEGIVANIVFPSGALVMGEKLFVYYGAADTRCAVASCNLADLLAEMQSKEKEVEQRVSDSSISLARYKGNPIIKPILELDWQSEGTFNPAAIYEDGSVHILYRAQSKEGTSVIGYAVSNDGLKIDTSLDEPIYTPRESFEMRIGVNGSSGCEDPRISKIDDRFYLTYTAYDGYNPTQVALSSIKVEDFLAKRWLWEKPIIISPPGMNDKNACIIKTRNSEYIAFHRLNDSIWIDKLKNLDFKEQKYLAGEILAGPRKDKWDNVKIGISSPPIETEKGYLLIYHGVTEPGFKYSVGAMLLDINDPKKVIARTDNPILEPEEVYEKNGQVANVVFPCGAVVIDGILYVYYGGADRVVCVATKKLSEILDGLEKIRSDRLISSKDK